MNTSHLSLHTPWQADWRPEFVGTLLFLLRDDEVLLIHKKTGHGAGRINGPGGKLDPGEGVIACACREVFEEVGLVVHDAAVGLEMRFVERDGPQWLGFTRTATELAGDLRETREAKPFWCPIADVPYDRMWPDDAIWLPGLLAGYPAPMSARVAVADFLFQREVLLEHSFDTKTASIWENFPT